MTTTVPGTSPTPAVAALRFREAFESVRDELAALPAADLLPLNLDIPSAVVTALGCGPELKDHRARIVEELPRFDVRQFDKLETYALAAGQAHTQHLIASSPAEPIADLVAELTKTREVLVSDVSALAKRNLLDGTRLAELRGPNGHKNVAFDVLLLASLLRDNWSTIGGRTGVQVSELDRAEQAADRLASAVGFREQGPGVASASAETRQRAFTLFVQAYDQVRRAVSYLRWDHGDADRIVPSLYAGRGGRRRGEPETDVPTPTNGNGNGATPPVVTTPAPIQPVNAPAPAPVTAPTGMPGNDPFGR